MFLKHGSGPCPCVGRYSLCIRPSHRRNCMVALMRTHTLYLPVISSSVPSTERRVRSNVGKCITRLDTRTLTSGVRCLCRGPLRERGAITCLGRRPVSFSGRLLGLRAVWGKLVDF